MPEVATTTTYKLTVVEAKRLMAKGADLDPDTAKVDFQIGEVDGDVLDRFPGRKDVVAVTITVPGGLPK